MAIVTISRIQHRRGDYADLPQLASAELGWAIDTQQLFIGNGGLVEGAPAVGNTEILTEHSDLFSKLASYIYKSNTAYEPVTGPTGNAPVARSLQDRLDDYVSVKSFGAVGDGVADDTAAIQRALDETYIENTNSPENRTLLYFPAGVYNIQDAVIKIPTYANILGDGPEKTIIRQLTSAMPYCAKFTDSLGQNYPNLGNNGATLPMYISISNMSFETLADASVFRIDSAAHCSFDNVKFKGTFEDLDVTPEYTASVTLVGSAAFDCHSITFRDCEFTKSFTHVICDDDYEHLVFDTCKFTTARKGILLGENYLGSGASLDGPRGVRIINCYFDSIADVGLYAHAPVTQVISAFNTFKDVGTGTQGLGATVSINSCIIFRSAGNMSIGDYFARTAVDTPWVDNDLAGSAVLIPGTGYQLGGMTVTDSDGTITLSDNTLTATTSGISFLMTNEQSAEIYYKIKRGTKVRTGSLTVSGDTSHVTMSDDYVENNGDLGVVFSISLSGSVATVKYTATSTGTSASMQYSIKTLRSLY